MICQVFNHIFVTHYTETFIDLPSIMIQVALQINFLVALFLRLLFDQGSNLTISL